MVCSQIITEVLGDVPFGMSGGNAAWNVKATPIQITRSMPDKCACCLSEFYHTWFDVLFMLSAVATCVLLILQKAGRRTKLVSE
jgi:hypothetical protein